MLLFLFNLITVDTLWQNAPCLWERYLQDCPTQVQDSLRKALIHKIAYNKSWVDKDLDQEEVNSLLNGRIDLVRMENLRQDVEIKKYKRDMQSYADNVVIFSGCMGLLTIFLLCLNGSNSK